MYDLKQQILSLIIQGFTAQASTFTFSNPSGHFVKRSINFSNILDFWIFL